MPAARLSNFANQLYLFMTRKNEENKTENMILDFYDLCQIWYSKVSFLMCAVNINTKCFLMTWQYVNDSHVFLSFADHHVCIKNENSQLTPSPINMILLFTNFNKCINIDYKIEIPVQYSTESNARLCSVFIIFTRELFERKLRIFISINIMCNRLCRKVINHL